MSAAILETRAVPVDSFPRPSAADPMKSLRRWAIVVLVAGLFWRLLRYGLSFPLWACGISRPQRMERLRKLHGSASRDSERAQVPAQRKGATRRPASPLSPLQGRVIDELARPEPRFLGGEPR